MQCGRVAGNPHFRSKRARFLISSLSLRPSSMGARPDKLCAIAARDAVKPGLISAIVFLRTAKVIREPPAFKGRDFGLTDIELAA
jgi:hypothetical protein